ncbi:casein kinase [Rhypophila sp. PSN 637]
MEIRRVGLPNNQYRVDRKIGKGGFGAVYSGTDIQLDQEVAIKLTHVRDGRGDLEREAETYKALAGGIGIPRVWWFGQECVFDVLLISRMEYIHLKGFLHRDIKPENFLMGTGRHGNILYAIDFGLAKEFCDAERCRDFQDRPFGGTSRYASINNHNGREEQSFRDDLEFIGYMLCYFACGSLPWQAYPGKNLCGDNLPGEFATYIDDTPSLGFDDKPNYSYLGELFRHRFRAEGFEHNNVFDWTEKRFMEEL